MIKVNMNTQTHYVQSEKSLSKCGTTLNVVLRQHKDQCHSPVMLKLCDNYATV